LIEHLKKDNINAVFHYLSLHKSPFYKDKHDGRELPMSDFFSDNLVRLPLFYELSDQEVNHIIESVLNFYK
jgi:dTDP-4-amino-4,6-dideoxygalactose transaminase